VANVWLQAMIYASRCVDLQESLNGAQYDEDSAVFFLELLIKVVLQNRSVVSPPPLRTLHLGHISLLMLAWCKEGTVSQVLSY